MHGDDAQATLSKTGKVNRETLKYRCIREGLASVDTILESQQLLSRLQKTFLKQNSKSMRGQSSHNSKNERREKTCTYHQRRNLSRSHESFYKHKQGERTQGLAKNYMAAISQINTNRATSKKEWGVRDTGSGWQKTRERQRENITSKSACPSLDHSICKSGPCKQSVA